MKKKTDAEIKSEVNRILMEIEANRQAAQRKKLEFACLDAEQVEMKVKGITSNSPYINSFGWTGSGASGSKANLIISMSNPDPIFYHPMFVSIFFGTANPLNDNNFLEALADGNFNRGHQWPYLSSEDFFFPPNAPSVNLSFVYTLPTGLPLTTYHGNIALWQLNTLGKGNLIDRGGFWVTLI